MAKHDDGSHEARRERFAQGLPPDASDPAILASYQSLLRSDAEAKAATREASPKRLGRAAASALAERGTLWAAPTFRVMTVPPTPHGLDRCSHRGLDGLQDECGRGFGLGHE